MDKIRFYPYYPSRITRTKIKKKINITLLFLEILSGVCYNNNNNKKEDDRKHKGTFYVIQFLCNLLTEVDSCRIHT